MATKKDVTTTQDQLPAEMLDFMGDMGAGMEGADKDSYAIPFLAVIQTNSPQVDEADAKYIEAAKPGMLFNSVTNELYDGKEGVVFLPCAYQRRFLRWGPRGGDGAGFKGEMLPEEVAAARQRGEIVEFEGRLYYPKEDGTVNPKQCDRVSDTRSHFGMVLDAEGAATNVLLSLSSTQIKKSKQLMSILSNVKIKTPNGMVTPPTWMNLMRITTVRESNDEGSWYGVKFTKEEGLLQDRDVYSQGKAFHESIRAGEVGARYEEPSAEEGGEGKF